jgi:hypothetical protein
VSAPRAGVNAWSVEIRDPSVGVSAPSGEVNAPSAEISDPSI